MDTYRGSLITHGTHKPEVSGSIPLPATIKYEIKLERSDKIILSVLASGNMNCFSKIIGAETKYCKLF